MKPTINETQFKIFFSYIQKHPEIVLQNLLTDAEFSRRIRLWISLADELNLSGPPEHNWRKWRNIWMNYKSRMERKIYSEVMDPNHKRKGLAERDAAVVNLIGLRHIVEEEIKKAKNPLPAMLNDGNNKSLPSLGNHKVKETSSMKEDKIPDLQKEPDVDSATGSLENSTENELQDEVIQYALNTIKSLLIDFVPNESDIFTATDGEISSETRLEQLLELLKTLNQQAKEANDLQQKRLQLEQTNLDEIKLTDLENIKLGDIKIGLKRKELEIYELKVKKSCSLCSLK